MVGRYLPLDACRADAVVDCSGAVCHAIGEVHQLTVEAGACRVGVLGDGFAFDVVGRAVSAEPFALLNWMLMYPIFVFYFYRFYKLVCSFPSVAVVPHENGGVQRG